MSPKKKYPSAQVGKIFMISWKKPTEADAEELVFRFEQFYQRVGKFILVVIMPDKSTIPKRETQNIMISFMNRLDEICDQVCLVLEGDGFGRALRGEVMSDLTQNMSHHKIFPSFNEALQSIPSSFHEDAKTAFLSTT